MVLSLKISSSFILLCTFICTLHFVFIYLLIAGCNHGKIGMGRICETKSYNFYRWTQSFVIVLFFFDDSLEARLRKISPCNLKSYVFELNNFFVKRDFVSQKLCKPLQNNILHYKTVLKTNIYLCPSVAKTKTTDSSHSFFPMVAMQFTRYRKRYGVEMQFLIQMLFSNIYKSMMTLF